MKTKFPRAAALSVAEKLQARLAPVCLRIAIAGSLRRLKSEVGDIELLYVPRHELCADGLFDKRSVDLADEEITRMLADFTLARRPNIKGAFTWGPSNKLAVDVASGIPVDLFATTEAKWWVSLVVRTGSKETNLRLTTGANKQGATLNAYGSGVTWSDGSQTAATSERHVFELCGLPYIDPEFR